MYTCLFSYSFLVIWFPMVKPGLTMGIYFLEALSRWTFMMMMYAFGNFGATDLQLLKLLQLLIMLLQLLVPLLQQQKGGIFLLYAVRIRLYFWIWSPCVDAMYQSKNLIINHFSGKSELKMKFFVIYICHLSYLCLKYICSFMLLIIF